MKHPEPAANVKTGRPLSFDRDEAVYRAMLLFWKHGYESTSISDLTKALKLTPPSIYNAFGDKKGLFREAVKRYLSGPETAETVIDKAPTAREAARRLLEGAARAYTGENTPPGCLMATSVISCSAASADLQGELAAIRRRIEAQLRAKIEQDVVRRELPAATDADVLAGYVMAVIQGLSTLARDGAERPKLLRIVELSMEIWPPAGRRAGVKKSTGT